MRLNYGAFLRSRLGASVTFTKYIRMDQFSLFDIDILRLVVLHLRITKKPVILISRKEFVYEEIKGKRKKRNVCRFANAAASGLVSA